MSLHPKMKEVLDKMVSELEQGKLPWKPPYQGGAGGLPIRVTGEAYQGSNVVLLFIQGMMYGYEHPMHMTYNQARKLGGHVRKDKNAAIVVFTDKRTVTETDEVGQEKERSFRWFRCGPQLASWLDSSWKVDELCR